MGQRYILIVSLTGAALIAHLTFCGWGAGGQLQFGGGPILIGWSGAFQSGPTRQAPPTRAVYGCYARGTRTGGILGGLLTPWFLLTGAACCGRGARALFIVNTAGAFSVDTTLRAHLTRDVRNAVGTETQKGLSDKGKGPGRR